MRVALLGDCAANDAILRRLQKGQEAQVAGDVPKITDACQCVVANLEGCWDLDGLAKPAGPAEKVRIRTTPHVIGLLKRLNVSVVSTANNHSFDFGQVAWAALRDRLVEAGFHCVGAGTNLREAARPVFVEQQGLKIGIIAYADRDCGAVFAGDHSPGVNPLEFPRASHEIRALKQCCDVVIVSVHWGEERIHMPAPKLRRWARAFAAAGADIVAGHHPHVLQGYELLSGSHVFYSLGNFLLADIWNNGSTAVRYCGLNHVSAIPLLQLSCDGVQRLDRVVGVRATSRGVKLADNWSFRSLWRRRCAALQSRDYERVFFRHQAWMWRYVIPFRYRLLREPLALLRRLNLERLARLVGRGSSPWRRKSL